MTFLFPFIVQSCKRILTTDPELLGRMRHSGFQMVYLSQTRFFLKKSLIKLKCTISPIYCAKFLKKLLAPIQSFEDVPFLGPKCPICPNKKSLVKPLILLWSTYWPLSVCKILKKLEWIQSYEDRPFWGPKWSICPKQELPIDSFHCAEF